MFKTRFISMLVLLMTAVTGAWATEVTIATNQQQTSYTSGDITISVSMVGDGDGAQVSSWCPMSITCGDGNVLQSVVVTIGFYPDNASDVTASAGSCEVSGDGNKHSTYVTVTGINASSVSIGCNGDVQIEQVVVNYSPSAVAQEETLLTTITPTGDGTYSETTAGAVTVTPTGSFFYSGSSYGWRWDSYGSLTVTANEGYTITRCVFIQQGKNQSVTISEAPFALNFEEWLCLENTSMDGVTSIEVYGTAPAAPAASTYTVTLKEGTDDANNWTITPAEATTTGVAAGTEVKATYSGTKKVKSVKAVKKVAASAETTVTWDFSQLSGTAGTGYENGGVKLEACEGEISFDYNQLNAWGNGITITNTLGKKFTSIVINGTEYGVGIFGGGWSNADDNSSATWTGNSESVYIEGSSMASGITSIVFTLE